MERKPVNQEVLNKEVNLTGHDSSPAVNALTSNEFLTNKDVDNIDIAAALVEILRG